MFLGYLNQSRTVALWRHGDVKLVSKIFSKNIRKTVIELAQSFTHLYIANSLEKVNANSLDRFQNELTALRRLQQHPELDP